MPVTPTQGLNSTSYKVTFWTGETGVGIAASFGRHPHVTVQAVGTGTVTIFGSNDGVNYVALSDSFTNTAISLSATAFAMANIKENPIWIRPVVTGGTANIIAVSRAT